MLLILHLRLHTSVVTKNWIASNLFGEAFATSAIQLLDLDDFKTGMLLLSGLFFYDVFWVFGTDVMVSAICLLLAIYFTCVIPLLLTYHTLPFRSPLRGTLMHQSRFCSPRISGRRSCPLPCSVWAIL